MMDDDLVRICAGQLHKWTVEGQQFLKQNAERIDVIGGVYVTKEIYEASLRWLVAE